MRIVYNIILIGLMLCSNVTAQVFVKSSSQQLIEDAVNGSFFIFRQNYQLKDSTSNEYFGLAGKEEFGMSYSLGVKLKGGYCITDVAMRPWIYDTNFDRYRSTHLPVINKTEYKELSDGSQYKTLGFSGDVVKPLIAEKLYQLEDSTFSGNGFSIDASKGTKEGWIVCITADKSLEETGENISFSYLIYRKDLNLEKERKEYSIDMPLINQKVWGGFYIVPEQTGIGQITFKLAGLLVGKDKEWVIITPFDNASVVSVLSDKESDKDELTPVKKEEDNKKLEKKKKRESK